MVAAFSAPEDLEMVVVFVATGSRLDLYFFVAKDNRQLRAVDLAWIRADCRFLIDDFAFGSLLPEL